MNESWRVVLQGDALAALTKYREKQADVPVPVTSAPEQVGRKEIRRAMKRLRAAKRRSTVDESTLVPAEWCDCEACKFFLDLGLFVHPWKAHKYWEAKQQGFEH